MVRKSSLTFAVETPADAWQMAINKAVSRDAVASILTEARRNGWRGAKFYFMVGLPVGEGTGQKSEEQEIVDFILEVAGRTGMHFNVNVGVFVPKPHTPYQWVPLIDEKTAREKIRHIRDSLKPRGHKVSYNDPFIALIEGVLSRGDERVGELVEEAYRRGCRFDAWDEHIKKDIWADLLERHGPLLRELTGERDMEKPLPWDCIGSGASKAFLKREYEKSGRSEFTRPCEDDCDRPCGNCNREARIISNIIHNDNLLQQKTLDQEPKGQDPVTLRMLFSFEKQRAAVFLPHLALIELFSMAFIRARIPILFTQGFNPLPKLDFAFPLSVGLQAGGEIASIDLEPRGGDAFTAGDFVRAMNRNLPEGMRVKEAFKAFIPSGDKKHAIPSLLWGSVYLAEDGGDDLVPAREEKSYRLSRTSAGRSLFRLIRKTVLAKSLNDPQTPDSYFAVYRSLYPLGTDNSGI
jgi:hypothetical protein